MSQDLIIYKGEKTFLYGKIQNIYFIEGPLDKNLGLASIAIETAAAGGGIARANAKNKISAFPLFGNNAIGIPGLTHDKALELKEFLMGRIKNNSINDAQSGL